MPDHKQYETHIRFPTEMFKLKDKFILFVEYPNTEAKFGNSSHSLNSIILVVRDEIGNTKYDKNQQYSSLARNVYY